MSDASFNLVDEGWIPCVLADSGDTEPRLLGLFDTLARAHEIRTIADPSPPVFVALHRLLLAILHRNFGPEDAAAWQALWENGAFDRQCLQEYLGAHKERFNLFDSEYPFYQTSEVPYDECDTSVARLAIERVAGNNPTLFDHTTDVKPPPTSPAKAIRLVIATQAVAVGGLIATRDGEARKTHGSADSAPLVKGAVTLVQGENLFETLMLNLHRYNGQRGEPFDFDPDEDRPAWESDSPTRPEDRRPLGYLDLLTWQSRRLRLKPENTDTGDTVVRHVALMKGNQFPDDFHRHGRETMLAFTRNEKASARQDPWPALAFTEGRALWRDSTTLFQAVQDQRARPSTLTWLNELADLGIIDDSAVLPLSAAGLSTDRAKILLWRYETLPLHVAYLSDEGLLDGLDRALAAAESGAGALYAGIRRLAELISQMVEGSKPDRDRVRQLVQSLGGDRRYWAQLERPFRRLLVDLPDAADQLGRCEEWTEFVCRVARDVFDQTVDGLDVSPRVLRAVYQKNGAQHRLNAALKKLQGDRKEGNDAAES
jgi:CRISPR system Cascade subunit CasA